jgi:hypothetical protein
MSCSEDCPVCPEEQVGTLIVPYVSYYDAENTDLMCAKRIGDTWGTKIVEWTEDNVGWHTSIAIDSDNNAHISCFQSSSDDLHYAVETDDGWLTEVVDSEADVGRQTSIAVDTQGNPHISYWNLSDNVIKYARKIGGGWNTHILESPYPPISIQLCSGDIGPSTSLCLDASGTPHICYVSSESSYSLAYAVKTGWMMTENGTRNLCREFRRIAVTFQHPSPSTPMVTLT